MDARDQQFIKLNRSPRTNFSAAQRPPLVAWHPDSEVEPILQTTFGVSTLSPGQTDLYSLVLPVLVRAGIAGRVLRIVGDYVLVLSHTSSVQAVLKWGMRQVSSIAIIPVAQWLWSACS